MLGLHTLRRVVVTALSGAMVVWVTAGCGHAQQVHTVTGHSAPAPPPAASDEVLGLAGLGAFHGRCVRNARSWPLRFVLQSSAASTAVSYRIGFGRRRTVDLEPGQAVTFPLVPNASGAHEPPDRFVPPPGEPRGLNQAMTVRTSQRLQAIIYQATEPQTVQADVSIALAPIGGESGRCLLVGSTVDARTYPNSR